MLDALHDIQKGVSGAFKPYTGFQDAVRETSFYLVGIAIEGGKQTKPEKGINIKGYLFLWPFVIAFCIVLYLLTQAFIVN